MEPLPTGERQRLEAVSANAVCRQRAVGPAAYQKSCRTAGLGQPNSWIGMQPTSSSEQLKTDQPNIVIFGSGSLSEL